MKKFLTILALAVLTPVLSFAVSLNDLTSNSWKYEFIASGNGFYEYIDADSIQSVSFNPGEWSCDQADIYMVDTKLQVITRMLMEGTYFYMGNRKMLISYNTQEVWDFYGNRIPMPAYRQVSAHDVEPQRGTFAFACANAIYRVKYGKNFR